MDDKDIHERTRQIVEDAAKDAERATGVSFTDVAKLFGPQKGPATVGQIEAQRKAAERDLMTSEPKYCQHRAEIDATWKAVEASYDIESRSQLEAEAKVNGFRFGLCQAVHHMWKRDPKVEALRAKADSFDALWAVCVDLGMKVNPPDEETEEEWAYQFGFIRSLATQADLLKEAEQIIADRGVFERDCSLPLPQRIDNLIVSLKTDDYNAMETERRLNEAEGLLKRCENLLNGYGSSAVRKDVETFLAKAKEQERG